MGGPVPQTHRRHHLVLLLVDWPFEEPFFGGVHGVPLSPFSPLLIPVEPRL